jgi:hypothetical protein
MWWDDAPFVDRLRRAGATWAQRGVCKRNMRHDPVVDTRLAYLEALDLHPGLALGLSPGEVVDGCLHCAHVGRAVPRALAVRMAALRRAAWTLYRAYAAYKFQGAEEHRPSTQW